MPCKQSLSKFTLNEDSARPLRLWYKVSAQHSGIFHRPAPSVLESKDVFLQDCSSDVLLRWLLELVDSATLDDLSLDRRATKQAACLTPDCFTTSPEKGPDKGDACTSENILSPILFCLGTECAWKLEAGSRMWAQERILARTQRSRRRNLVTIHQGTEW
jgi:hypothetical protein